MYLDPSFAGMLGQIIIAVIAGGGAILFGMRRKIKAFFTRNKDDVEVDFKSTGNDEIVDMMEDGFDK